MMTGLGLHISRCKCPGFPVDGKYRLMGSIPLDLFDIRPASQSDVMAGRAWRNEDNQLVTYRTRYYATLDELLADVACVPSAKLCSLPGCACRQHDKVAK